MQNKKIMDSKEESMEYVEVNLDVVTLDSEEDSETTVAIVDETVLVLRPKALSTLETYIERLAKCRLELDEYENMDEDIRLNMFEKMINREEIGM